MGTGGLLFASDKLHIVACLWKSPGLAAQFLAHSRSLQQTWMPCPHLPSLTIFRPLGLIFTCHVYISLPEDFFCCQSLVTEWKTRSGGINYPGKASASQPMTACQCPSSLPSLEGSVWDTGSALNLRGHHRGNMIMHLSHMQK